MSIVIKPIRTQDELGQSFAIRREVFVEEQQVPVELEMDEWDETATHFLAWKDGHPIGTCRMRWLDATTCKVERVAVLQTGRNLGIGKKLMEAVESVACEQGALVIALNAQSQVIPFYLKLGYETLGEPFEEAGIAHMKMKKSTQLSGAHTQ